MSRDRFGIFARRLQADRRCRSRRLPQNETIEGSGEGISRVRQFACNEFAPRFLKYRLESKSAHFTRRVDSVLVCAERRRWDPADSTREPQAAETTSAQATEERNWLGAIGDKRHGTKFAVQPRQLLCSVRAILKRIEKLITTVFFGA